MKKISFVILSFLIVSTETYAQKKSEEALISLQINQIDQHKELDILDGGQKVVSEFLELKDGILDAREKAGVNVHEGADLLPPARPPAFGLHLRPIKRRPGRGKHGVVDAPGVVQ